MKIGNLSVWTSAQEAAAIGCTHHARFFGVIPGFASDDSGGLPVGVSLRPVQLA